MVKPIYFLKPAWCGTHFAGLWPEQGLQPVTRATALRRWISLGVKLVGVTGANGRKLLFTIVFLAIVWLLAWVLGCLTKLVRERYQRAAFWIRQGVHLFSAAFAVIGVCSIWFDNPARLTTAFGLVTAGLGFALQRVITSFAAYIVVLRGRTFNVGDRIAMAGVRGDVIDLGFIQTTIMEMGEPPEVQSADPAMWVKARQYSGRVVSITNDKIFETPVYNYSREFPFIWEEMMLPIAYESDWQKAEQIILDAARRNTLKTSEISEASLAELERRYFIRRSHLEPRVFVRLTENWIELSVRFITREHGVRELKDNLSREILEGLNLAKIGVASGTYQIVGMPPISVKIENSGA